MPDGTDILPTDNFSEAFDRLADLGNQPDPATLEAPAAPVTPAVEPPTVPPVQPPEPVVEPPVVPPVSLPETPAPEPVPSPATPPADADLMARLATLLRQATPAEPAKAAEPPAPEPVPDAPLYTDDEQKLVDQYVKDWPEVAQAEVLRRRAEYRDLVGYVFAEVAKEFRPVAELVRSMADQQHLAQLETTVTDYADVRDKVIDWVEKQPAYLQPAYQHVIQQGTVDEVADLINRYKRDTTGSTSAPAVPRKTETELPSATKQAAAALAPVSSKRSAVVQPLDSTDFDSAFVTFADKL